MQLPHPKFDLCFCDSTYFCFEREKLFCKAPPRVPWNRPLRFAQKTCYKHRRFKKISISVSFAFRTNCKRKKKPLTFQTSRQKKSSLRFPQQPVFFLRRWIYFAEKQCSDPKNWILKERSRLSKTSGVRTQSTLLIFINFLSSTPIFFFLIRTALTCRFPKLSFHQKKSSRPSPSLPSWPPSSWATGWPYPPSSPWSQGERKRKKNNFPHTIQFISLFPLISNQASQVPPRHHLDHPAAPGGGEGHAERLLGLWQPALFPQAAVLHHRWVKNGGKTLKFPNKHLAAQLIVFLKKKSRGFVALALFEGENLQPPFYSPHPTSLKKI